ncbi:NUDIX hydrolase [Plantactinospora sp. S1510]|uniref:NUDIX hydrolase n=2 Tax=Plantactinospora alkalitolerans TaxID=2789879 RepID=A0ABS0HAC4_9ACTN|nr:NUDIX hydrolase [Plantactinospora alkalitolerans]MBF9135211.1 NUDIX hydrolase [Plantactinospora alkalitolerans]
MCGDAFVTVRNAFGGRHLLLGERSDSPGCWVLPGGKADPGEDPVDAAVRELEEETGLTLFRSRDAHVVGAPQLVPDPRAGRRAWMVTVLVTFDLGEFDDLPTVAPQPGEFERVAWVPADTYDQLVQYLADNYGGKIGVAHQQMIAEALSA